MKRIFLSTKRLYNWKLFWVLLGLNVPAAFALIPFALNLQNAFSETATSAAPGWEAMVLDRIVVLALIAVLGGIGLALSNRIGLGMPFVESWVRREPPPRRFRGIVAVGALVGIGCAVLILGLDYGVFRLPMLNMVQELGLKPPKGPVSPPLYGFLAAISAGVTEETMFRLFGLSLLAWLGSVLISGPDSRPTLPVLWTANLLFALIFGVAHLANAAAIGLPINALVLIRTLALNTIAGLAFGWLFWTYGLESAMLAHFFTDVGLYTLLPVILLQEGQAATILAIVAVALAVLAGMSWAVRTLLRESTETESSSPAPGR